MPSVPSTPPIEEKNASRLAELMEDLFVSCRDVCSPDARWIWIGSRRCTRGLTWRRLLGPRGLTQWLVAQCRRHGSARRPVQQFHRVDDGSLGEAPDLHHA